MFEWNSAFPREPKPLVVEPIVDTNEPQIANILGGHADHALYDLEKLPVIALLGVDVRHDVAAVLAIRTCPRPLVGVNSSEGFVCSPASSIERPGALDSPRARANFGEPDARAGGRAATSRVHSSATCPAEAWPGGSRPGETSHLSRPSPRVSRWVAAHEELTVLARRRSELDGLEGPALLRALREGVHRHLGLGSFAEYVERLFGYSRRTLEDKLRTAEALEGLPVLARSLREGTLGWSAVRELARVATAETEGEWLVAARGRPVQEVERMVSGRRRGARPTDEIEASEQRHTLRFDVSADTFATFREAMKVLRQKANASLDDDSALLLMAREVLGGPADEGKSSYQLALNLCERCGRGSLDARGEVIAVDETIVATARCDAQYVGSATHPSHTGANEATSETHVGVNDAADQPRVRDPSRAAQTIPPALRRKVMRRDHGCCVVPGCRHATFVDLHHIEPRAEGGRHDEDNLVVLCSAHHRALHRGQLEIIGKFGRGLVFRRGDGGSYGALDAPRAADSCERAYRGLRNMGFKEGDARRAVERSRSSGATEAVLRRALSLLTERVTRGD